jgi:hypothetical protein
LLQANWHSATAAGPPSHAFAGAAKNSGVNTNSEMGPSATTAAAAALIAFFTFSFLSL